MVKIFINNIEFLVESGLSVLEACEYVGVDVPRFCYHQKLSVAGNCRMCLVEILNSPKPVASCALPISNNMKIFIDSPLVKKARENVLEALLLNHPLDCPICDQGGECDLQDQSKVFGLDLTRFFFKKRSVEDKFCGPIIKTIMTRCIHCTRCVRYNAEITGNEFFGTLNRGSLTEIGPYTVSTYNSEMSGNVIDLCPVGALTSKTYSFKARPWELRTTESIDLSDGLGSNIYINSKESDILRIFPKINYELNNSFISDKARYSFDSNKINRVTQDVINSEKKNSFLEKEKVCVLVDSNLDLQNFFYSKNLENTYINKKKINLKSTNNLSLFNKNLYVNWLSSSVLKIDSSIKTCFIVSSNIKIENAILNTKIRMKQNQNNLLLFGFCIHSYNDLNIEVLNLNVTKAFSFFESKFLILSDYLLKFNNPLIILGESLSTRGLNIFFLIKYLKSIIFKSIILKIGLSANQESFNFLKSSPINNNILKKNISFISINLEDSYFFMKYFKKCPLIRISTHKTDMLLENLYIEFPNTTIFEEEKVFINLENRIQKTSKIFSSSYQKFSGVKNIFIFLFKNVFNFIYKKHLDFVQEMLNNPNLFLAIQNNKNFYYFLLKNCLNTDYNKISKYPSKVIIEDFFLSNLSLKNSLIMQKCSQSYRKNFTNFQ